MEAGGAIPAGSGRNTRLDPFALPVRFPVKDVGADGQMRQVELDRERVILRRAVRGMRMKIRLSIDAFAGITLVASNATKAMASVVLDHSDPSLSIVLVDGVAAADATAAWKAWGRVLGLSLRKRDHNGATTDVRPGRRAAQVAENTGRRRRRSVIKTRRPSILLRRKAGRHIAMSVVHRGEREIIARN